MRRLLIFLKYPIPGRVKTRLAESLGAEAASAAYRACVELTLEQMKPLRHETVLCVDPPEAIGRARRWLGSGWAFRPQRGGSLGERLAQATALSFAEGATPVVVIGTDSPWLDAGRVEAAFDALARAELVLGPTEDGGYYLIGCSRAAPELFAGIAWSTSAVLAQTLAKAGALGLSVEQLPMGYDVDHLKDLDRFMHSRRREPCLS